MEFILELVSIIVASIAAVISISTFVIQHRSVRKTEQMKIAMEINSKLDDAENKIFEIKDQIKQIEYENEDLSPYQSANSDKNIAKISILKRNLKDASLHYMNLWEFLSFLVNKKEIHNSNIIEFFKPNLISGTDDVFEDYPEIKNNKNVFEEIKQLRKKWDDESNSLNK